MSIVVENFICSECLDPFENPECEAFDVFVNEILCVGKGTWPFYSVCVPHGKIGWLLYQIYKAKHGRENKRKKGKKKKKDYLFSYLVRIIP